MGIEDANKQDISVCWAGMGLAFKTPEDALRGQSVELLWELCSISEWNMPTIGLDTLIAIGIATYGRIKTKISDGRNTMDFPI